MFLLTELTLTNIHFILPQPQQKPFPGREQRKIMNEIWRSRPDITSYVFITIKYATRIVAVIWMIQCWYMIQNQKYPRKMFPHEIQPSYALTHWGRVTQLCIGKSTIIGSDNGLSPDRRQAISWTNAGILLIGPLGTYFSEILNGIQTFSLKKMHLKMSSAKCRPFCLGLNVFTVDHVQHTWWLFQKLSWAI